ncbi:LysM peptidoglycan-binding domain-containing protein [Vitiosangium sp. GDMCC 1.1324]|uniref:LysM peptidoglycan-binding domain-containing protein n=1 Tax=Vitiosangium sp. (strain GDMCC 1.1324) TaxID=2138576 RepID=UPI000D3B4A7E|nr:LysM peptidoglycan-binding domain-containing protein [Vitiosangium sp. GDMCC 1.1324]PTL77887.1 peptidoglycan-binding protein [Vitiosangium sp. GDMCC 1.1324]
MKGSLLLALLMLAPTEVVVRDGESLAQVAQRTLGDRGGASELKALNGLKDDAVAPGTKLRLPGADRARAQSVLETARNAVKHADAKAARREEAVAKLKEAEAHFQNARYEDAAQAADGAWKLLSVSASPPTAFTVAVDDKGTTTVRTRSGQPVRVEAEGVTRPVAVGESVRVEKGQPPPPPRSPLGVPQPMQPADKLRLSVQFAKGGQGPVTLVWQAVEGAEGYEVELTPLRGEKRVMSATVNQLKVTLPAGIYRWSVRALAHDNRSELSAEQGFEVAEASPKSINLQVQPSKWK